MDRLILLPEGDAIRTFVDDRNCRVLFRLLLLFALVVSILGIEALATSNWIALSLALINLVAIRALYQLRERPFFLGRCRAFLIGVLVLQPLFFLANDVSQASWYYFVTFSMPLTVVFFRLPTPLLLIPVGLLWNLTIGRTLVEAAGSDATINYGIIVGHTALSIIVLWVAAALSRQHLRGFLGRWRREHRRYVERTRMKGELDDARRIQLSMLPRSDPKIPWLDIAGISIPASEVGGDYYDYFTFSATLQAVVIGDVAGHGVASGLLLSGIRSCLYLLQETPLPPDEILRKLDRMVRQTTGRRIFVSMLYALIDREAMQLTVSAAGHPPLLHYRAAQRDVEEIALYALPLGTPLGGTFNCRVVPFAAGDTFVFYTDGIAETANASEEIYGDNERLPRRLREIAHDRPARAIRETLLSDVASFKGDREQLDDITIVVIKARDEPARPTAS